MQLAKYVKRRTPSTTKKSVGTSELLKYKLNVYSKQFYAFRFTVLSTSAVSSPKSMCFVCNLEFIGDANGRKSAKSLVFEK